MNIKKTVSWEDVRYFIALVRYKTLKNAAQNLGVEHTTVSRRISSLEESIQLTLFNRLPKSWNITHQGKELFAYALTMEECAANFVVKAESINPLSSKIKISAPPILISEFFAPRHVRLKQKIPEVYIEWVGEKRKVNLNAGEADIAIRMGGLDDSALKMRKLGYVEYAIYCAEDKITDTNEEKCFVSFSSSSVNTTLYDWYKTIASGSDVYAESGDFLTSAQLVKHSNARALLPKFLAQRISGIVVDDHYTNIPVVPAYLLIQSDIAKKPLIKCVAEELSAIFRSYFKH